MLDYEAGPRVADSSSVAPEDVDSFLAPRR